MAGPTASVLFADSPPYILTWREMMIDVADSWHDPSLCHVANSLKFGGTYQGEPRPFVGDIYRINDTAYYGAGLEEIAAINNAADVTFTHCVELGAMCKSPIDHQLLCEIARFLAQRHNGYVDFNAVITETPRPDLLTVKWTEDGHDYSTQIGTASACDWWLAQSCFHMVK